MTSVLARLALSMLMALSLAFAGCGEKEDKVDVKAQMAALGGDADTKLAALGELAKAGPAAASAVSEIIPLLKDEDEVIRRTAAYALGAIGPAAKAALPDLKALLESNDRDQLTAAVNAIRAIDPSAPAVKVDNVTNPQ